VKRSGCYGSLAYAWSTHYEHYRDAAVDIADRLHGRQQRLQRRRRIVVAAARASVAALGLTFRRQLECSL